MPRSARARAAFTRAASSRLRPILVTIDAVCEARQATATLSSTVGPLIRWDAGEGVRGQAGDRHVVEHRAALDQVDSLEGAADALVEPLVRRPPGDVGAGENH